MFATGDAGLLGLTTCSSILKYDPEIDDPDEEDPYFYGAICVDFNPSGPLSNVFNLDP